MMKKRRKTLYLGLWARYALIDRGTPISFGARK